MIIFFVSGCHTPNQGVLFSSLDLDYMLKGGEKRMWCFVNFFFFLSESWNLSIVAAEIKF